MPHIEAANVALIYDTPSGRVPAVEDVSFGIETSEFLCIVGPSGCGKSSLLNIIAGFLTPTRGEIRIGGRPVADGIHAALRGETNAGNGQDARLGSGAAPIREYLFTGLVDEMHLAISPVLLGSGEHLLAGFNAPQHGYQCAEHVSTPNATHVVITRRK